MRVMTSCMWCVFVPGPMTLWDHQRFTVNCVHVVCVCGMWGSMNMECRDN